jgi:hypothetical protein
LVGSPEKGSDLKIRTLSLSVSALSVVKIWLSHYLLRHVALVHGLVRHQRIVGGEDHVSLPDRKAPLSLAGRAPTLGVC